MCNIPIGIETAKLNRCRYTTYLNANFIFARSTKYRVPKHYGITGSNTKMCLCLGPFKSGKTVLMKRLQGDVIDDATHTVSTSGINLFTVKNDTGEFDMIIKEIGGDMAPIWKHYYEKVRKVIFVVDASNLCEISAAAVLLYSSLVEPRLQNTEFALILNKMDLSYRQMRNEALLMLHLNRLRKEITQRITVIETSGMTGQGIEELRGWLFDLETLKATINMNK